MNASMNINIYGSTGIIGKKSLKLIEKYFPNIKVNLLCAKSNVHTLREQISKFKPKYVYLHDSKKALDLKSKIDSRIKILNYILINIYNYILKKILILKQIDYL